MLSGKVRYNHREDTLLSLSIPMEAVLNKGEKLCGAINQSINQSVNQSISQSVSQSVSQSINQSVNQSINQPVISQSLTLFSWVWA